MQFEDRGLAGGIWRGLLRAPAPGRVMLVVRGEAVAQAVLSPEGEGWRVEAALPMQVLGDGVQTLLLVRDDAETGPVQPGAELLGRMSIIAGRALDEDVAGELHQLRAELDLLKREFRMLARRIGPQAD